MKHFYPIFVPVLQIVGAVATLRRLGRWHRDPSSHPLGGRKWAHHILLPLIPDVLVSLPLLGLLWTGTLDVMLLYMPDVSWIALVCGSFALVWMFVRTGLVLRALRKPSLS